MLDCSFDAQKSAGTMPGQQVCQDRSITQKRRIAQVFPHPPARLVPVQTPRPGDAATRRDTPGRLGHAARLTADVPGPG